MVEAYHLTLPDNAAKILKGGMKKNSYWFPNSLFPYEWKSSGLKESLLDYFYFKNRKSLFPLAVLKCELLPSDKAFVHNLFSKFGFYEVRQSLALDNYLLSGSEFRVPEIVVKNKILAERISFAGYVENAF